MSANFFDNSGVMGGVDLHDFYLLTPTPVIGPLGVPPQKYWPHAVAAPHFWKSNGKRTARVKSDNWKMIQLEFSMTFVPHVPFASLANYGAVEYAYLPIVIAKSSSTATMGVASVTGEGAELATCLLGPIGWNNNCSDAPSILSQVLNLNTVKTSPTLFDYLRWLLTMVLKNVLGWWDRRMDKKFADKIKDLPLGKQIVARLKRWLWQSVRKLAKKLAAWYLKYKGYNLPDMWEELKKRLLGA